MAAGEFELIERFFADLGADRDDVLLGVGDDAALLAPSARKSLTLCTDTLVAGVHFPLDAPAEDVGFKALAVNLSDLAAMAAEPAWALLSLTLPEADEQWVAGFAAGFGELARRFDVALVGGDTTQGPLAVSVHLAGWVDPALALRRDRAQAGDAIYVSGTLGDAAAGLRIWQGDESLRSGPEQRFLIERLQRPQPRVELGVALAGVAACAVDISDGLAADLGHILRRSGVGARIDVDALPLSAALRTAVEPAEQLQFALSGGDDYELCFTVAPFAEASLSEIAQRCGISLTRIGVIEAEPGLRLCHRDGREAMLPESGWQHFMSRTLPRS